MKTQAYIGTRYLQRDSNLPTFSGTATDEIGKIGSVAQICVGGEYYQVPIDPVTGKYFWNATIPLPDGDYSVSVVVVDRAGNAGRPALYTLRVDTTPPDAPDLINLYDNQGVATGSFDGDAATDDKRPTLTGLAQKGAIVYLRDVNGNTIGSAKADAVTGKWVLEPEIDLKNGANNLTLVTAETFANQTRESAPSAPFTVVIGVGGSSLQQGVVNAHDVDSSARETNIQAYQFTEYAQRDTSLPTLSGSDSTEIGKAGSIARFSIGGEYYEVPVDPATGKYAWTANVPMPDGEYSVWITIKDRAGNISKPKLFTLVIDTTPPEAPELLNLYDDQGLKIGSFDSGATLDDKRPTFTGVAQEGTTIYLRDASGSIIGSTVADKVTGKWVLIPTVDLNEGINNLSLVAEEMFAKRIRQGASSAPFKVIIDTIALAPMIVKGVDDTKGTIADGGKTTDTTPTLEGTGEPGSNVYVEYRDSNGNWRISSTPVTVNASGAWSWTAPALAPGKNWEFRSKIIDIAGNISSYSTSFNVTIEQKFSSGYEGFDNQSAMINTNYPGHTFKSGLHVVGQAGYADHAHVSDYYSQFGFSVREAFEWGKGSVTQNIKNNSNLKFTLPALTNKLSFSLGMVDGWVIIKTYDAAGQVIESRQFYGDIDIVRKDFYFQSTSGIAGFSIQGIDEINGMVIDSVRWGDASIFNSNSYAQVDDITDINTISSNSVQSKEQISDHILMSEIGGAQTLIMTGANQTLTLNELAPKLTSIDVIDISGIGNNTLNVSVEDILAYGNTGLFVNNDKLQLLVQGNEDDIVKLIPANAAGKVWIQQPGILIISGIEYRVFSNGDAELIVQMGVKVEMPIATLTSDDQGTLQPGIQETGLADIHLHEVLSQSEMNLLLTDEKSQSVANEEDESNVELTDYSKEVITNEVWQQHCVNINAEGPQTQDFTLYRSETELALDQAMTFNQL